MSDHEAYLHQLDAESAQVRRLAAGAAAQRRNEEQTYYLNQKPYTHCEGGKLYDCYLLHKGNKKCPAHLDPARIGIFNAPQEALARAQQLSVNVRYCPECMSNMVSGTFIKAYSQSFYSKEPKLYQYVLGKAAIVGRDSQRVTRILHHKDCSHYQLKGGVDFGYQTSFNAFVDAVMEAYPEISVDHMLPCVECFPDMWSGLNSMLKERKHNPSFRHIMQEIRSDGQLVLHYYGCADCSNNGEDLGWSSCTSDLINHLNFDFNKQTMTGFGHCNRCMREAEYEDIRQELVNKLLELRAESDRRINSLKNTTEQQNQLRQLVKGKSFMKIWEENQVGR